MLVIDRKFLEGTWWKYGAALSGAHLAAWTYFGYKINPDFGILIALQRSYVVLGAFVLAAFLPFASGRLQFKRLMWASLVGWILAICGYFMLLLYEPTRRFQLLPFMAFLQIFGSAATIGIVIELGRFVWIKVFEE